MSRKDHFGFPAPAGRPQFPGTRWWPMMGVYSGVADTQAEPFFSEPTRLTTQYDNFVLDTSNPLTPTGNLTKEANYLNLNGNPTVNDPDGRRFWFAGGRKYRWRDMLKDETVPPSSREEARNPDWGNYKWNLASWNGLTGVDPIGEFMESPVVLDGKAKVMIFVATTATSERQPVPAWVMTPLNNTIYHLDATPIFWTDGDTGNPPGSAPPKDHLKLYKPGARQAMTDFLIALVRKYGEDERIGCIVHGEYYPNDDVLEWLPADFDNDTYRAEMYGVWQEIVRYAPRDRNGNRVNLIQGQPITSGGFFTKEEVEDAGIGSSGSGVGDIFNAGPSDVLREYLYRRQPTQHQVNPGNIIDGEPQTWPLTPANPFGLEGQTAPIEYQHVAWAHSSGGVLPLDSLFLRYQDNLREEWHLAYEKFGPNGTLAMATPGGQIPHYPLLQS